MPDHLTKVKILTAYEGMPDSRSRQCYEQHGGYQALRKALAMPPAEITALVKASGLRGRGGAGFPTGLKWSFVPQDSDKPKYLVCNNDEGEPGTFKDRYICELSPHMLIEGMIISARAFGGSKGYIYTRYEFFEEIAWLRTAIDEAYAAGYLGNNILASGFDFDLDHYEGAGAYICGEETGLLSSLEGKKGYPKLKPPFPAVSGYLDCPTIVNNTETLAAVPWIITHGAEAYRRIGTEKSAGTKLFCISGHVQRPGVYEVPLGYPFMKFLQEDAGGMVAGRKLKGCIPGGASAPILTPDELQNVTLDYENLAAQGSMLGSGAIIIIDEEQSMVELLKVIVDFFHHESCGQCTPCREGTGWLANIMHAYTAGQGKASDLSLMHNISQHMMGHTICALSDAAALPTQAMVQKYQDELKDYLQAKAG